MIGNGRRGAGERDRDLEEDDELEGREERNSESGGGGGGFGGWRTHLLGGLTQRVKSWYWGARPLVSFLARPARRRRVTLSLFLLSFSSTVLFLSFVVFPFFVFFLLVCYFFFLPLFLSHSVLFIFSLTRPLRRHVTLSTDFAERREEGKGVRGKTGQWIKRDSQVLTKD